MNAKDLVREIDGAQASVRSSVAAQLLTPSECAEQLDVSPSTFLWWVNNQDDFPKPFKDYGGKRGYRPLYWWNDVEAWYNQRESKKG